MFDRFLAFSIKYPLDVVSYLLILVPFVSGLFVYARLCRAEKIFLYYFLLVFLKETLGLIIMLSGEDNVYLQNAQTFIDIIFFGLAFHYALYGSRNRLYLTTAAVVSLIAATAFFDWQDVAAMNQVAGRLFAIVAVLLLFNDILTEMRVVYLAQYPMFWLSSGLLLYATGTFLLALFSQVMFLNVVPDEIFDSFWNMQQVLLIVFCVFAAVGFWVSRYQSRQTT